MIAFLQSLFRRPEPAIFDARAADAGALARVHANAFLHGWSESEFERLLAERSTVCHVARASGGTGSICGFVISRIIEDEAEILMVAVSRSEQSRGLARRMIARHLGRLAAHGARQVFLEVDEGNAPAIRLYAGAGFEQVGERPGYYAEAGKPPAAALIMRRSLD
ncbi:MAG TPA: GNAT family N-acetyltransferase [Xanthobacteraceae bacterium]|nr:GNAT family N-acetyltransferase [Xanthobacteraceae bacterium]